MQVLYLASADGASAESEGWYVGVPPAPRRVEERVTAKVAPAAVLRGRAAGGAAGALLDDRGCAVGGRADHRVTLHLASLTAGAGDICHYEALGSSQDLPANLTLLVGRLPSVAVLKECSLVGTLLLHVLDQLLVPDLLPEVPQVAGDNLQVVPRVPRQAGLGGVDTIQSALEHISSEVMCCVNYIVHTLMSKASGPLFDIKKAASPESSLASISLWRLSACPRH